MRSSRPWPGCSIAEAAGDGRVSVDMGPAAPRLARDPAGRSHGHAAPRCCAAGRAHAIPSAASTSATRTRCSSSPTPRRSISTALGPVLEHHPLFPERANVGVAHDPRARDASACGSGSAASGITRACGTGACATLVAAARRGLTGRARRDRARRRRARDRMARRRPRAHDRAGRRRASPASCPERRPELMTCEIVTFGCRLNAYESEVMRGHAARGRARPTRSRQHLRRHRRGRAPGAPGDPQGAARAARGAHRSSPAAPRRSIPPRFAAMPEVDLVLGNAEKLSRETFARLAAGEPARVAVDDIMSGARDRRRIWSTASKAARAPSSRCSRAATIAAPSASSPMGAATAALGAGRRDRRRRPRRLVAQGYREIVLTGVDITGYGADLPGRPTPRPAGAPPAGASAGAGAAAPLLARPGRDRRRSLAPASPRSRG